MKKRGFVDVDWGISLGIFLIYLAWFFIFISPFFETRQEIHPLETLVKQGLEQEIYWEVSAIPLIIDTGAGLLDQAVVVDFGFNYSRSNFTIDRDTYFDVDNEYSKLVLLGDFSRGKNKINIYTSNLTYENEIPYYDITSDYDYATTLNSSFEVELVNYTINKIYYNTTALESMNITVQGGVIPINESDYESSWLYSRYTHINEYYRLNTYVIALTKSIMMDFHPYISDNVNITAYIGLPRDYEKYYINNDNKGQFVANASGCINASWNYIDLYHDNYGITFTSNETMKIMVCYDNETIKMNISFPIKTGRFEIAVHDDDYNKTINKSLTIQKRWGLKEDIRGISYANMLRLSQKDYNTLKTEWDFPTVRDFSIFLKDTDNDNLLVYQQKEPALSDDVYVDDIYCQILYQNGSKTKCRLLIQTW
jgi:hypothetical protein